MNEPNELSEPDEHSINNDISIDQDEKNIDSSQDDSVLKDENYYITIIKIIVFTIILVLVCTNYDHFYKECPCKNGLYHDTEGYAYVIVYFFIVVISMIIKLNPMIGILIIVTGIILIIYYFMTLK